MPEIVINVSSQQGHSEVDISGSATEFVSLANYLTENITVVLSLKNEHSAYFPTSMNKLSIEHLEQSNGLVTAQIDGKEFKILGDSQAFQKLANFLESVPNLSAGEHFHLDWFSNEDLLAPVTSNMSFIFSIKHETE